MFPIIMEDSRIMTNYIPNGMYDKMIQEKQNITNNSVYRRYLTNNANNIININKNTAIQQNVPMMFGNKQPNNSHPILFDGMKMDENIYPKGYQTNTVKIKYLSSLELNAKKLNKYRSCNI